MHKHRQELLRSATRRIQRGRRTTGRIVASALGFSVAYYFDPESGGLRRKHLQHAARGLFGQINDALAPDIADPAVFLRSCGPTPAAVCIRWQTVWGLPADLRDSGLNAHAHGACLCPGWGLVAEGDPSHPAQIGPIT
jgi:hypothetical protein